MKTFISYRRDDSQYQAGRIYDSLVHQFGVENVFKDVDSIPLGTDFRQVLSEAIERCDVVVALIGDHWADAKDADGNLRISNPNDFVRVEIESALAKKIPVIPVLVGRAPMPEAIDFPESIRELAYRNGITLRPDPFFHCDIKRLVTGLEQFNKVSTPTVPAETDVENRTWNRVQSTDFQFNWPVIAVSTAIFLLSLLSLSMAYFGPESTETWQRRFDRLQDRSVPAGTGFAIEAVRLFLFLSSTCAVCLWRFGEPLRRFFSPRLNVSTVWIARIVVLLLVSFFLKSEVSRHWNSSKAGAEMAKWAEARGIVTTAEREIVSYRWYLPYSLSIYIFVFVGLIACPLLQFLLSDFRYLRSRLDTLAKCQSAADTSKAKLALLHQFGHGCRELTTRYVDAAGVLAIGIQYDYWIGRWTLTDDGFSTEVLAWVVMGVMVGLFLVICHIYSQGIELTLRSLGSQDFEAEQSMNRIGLLWLLKSSLVNRMSGMAFLSLVIIVLSATLERTPLLT